MFLNLIYWVIIGWMRTPVRCIIETNYRQTSNISRTFEGDKLVDHPDVVVASPVGAAPTASSFSI